MEKLYGTVNPVCFQRKVLDTDFVVAHFHPGLEIVYVTSGAIQIERIGADGQKSLVYVYPHEFTIVAPNSFHVLKSAVAGTSILEIELLHANPKISLLDWLNTFKILSDCKQFRNTVNSVTSGAKFYDNNGVDKILQKIILLLDDRAVNGERNMFDLDYTVYLADLLVQICHCKLLPEQSQDNLHINRMITFIKSNYEKDLSIATIADMLSLSPSYIQMLFKKEMGISIIAYTNKIRLEHALELMEEGSKDLQQIATLCGFKNYRNLYNNFTKKYKMIPTEWLAHAPKEIFGNTP